MPTVAAKLIIAFCLIFSLALFLVMMTTFFGLPGTEYTGRRGSIKSEVFSGLSQVADLKQERIKRWFVERITDVAIYSTNELVEIEVARLLAIKKARSREEDQPAGDQRYEYINANYRLLIDFLKKILTIHPECGRLDIVSADSGRILVSTDRNMVGASIEGAPYLVGALKTRGSYIGPIELDPAGGEPVLYISHMIKNLGGGSVALFVLQVKAEEIIKTILETGDRLGNRGEAYLVDEQGRLLTSLAHPLPTGEKAEILKYEMTTQPAIMAAQGEEGIIEALDYRGERVLAAYRHIGIGPHLGWGLVVKRDSEEVYAPLYSEALNSFLIGLLGVITVILVTIFSVFRLTKPIRNLSRAVEDVAGGNLSARAEITTSDEIGRFAEMFNSMVSRIQAWQKELEEVVRLRTSELNKKNARLEEEIAERLKVEEALKESEERFRQLAENIEEVFWAVSPDWRVVHYVSPAYEKIWGRSRQSLYDHPWSWVDVIVEEDRQLVLDYISRKAQGDLEEIVFPEYRLQHPDGSIRWIKARGFAAYNQAGELDGVVGIAADITEAKTYELFLKQSEEQLRSIADALPVLISYKDSDERYRFANKSYRDWFGLRPDQIIGRKMAEVVGQDMYNQGKPFLSMVMDGLPAAYEGRMTGVGGVARHYFTRLIPRFSPEGGVIGHYSLTEDITQRKDAEEEKDRLEKQLRQSHKMEAVGTLAGGIAHDFNNILSAILGYSELAEMDINEGRADVSVIHNIVTASNRAKDLVQQILAFSRKAQQERKPLEPAILLKEVIKFLRATLPSSIEIEADIPPGIGNILADATQIHQVVINLCTNAFHAMRDQGGILSLKLDRRTIHSGRRPPFDDLAEGEYIRITVMDTGPGIEAGIMDRIFEPFFTTKDFGEGAGMGLAVVHGIVKSHGGGIDVKNQLGKGAVFEVLLPVIPSEDQEEPESPAPIPRGSEKILFVDDEEQLVTVGKRTLERLGYDVLALTDSTQALEEIQARAGIYDLVITDMTMPRLNGMDLAREIIKIRSDLPIILCTGYSDAVTEEGAGALGISAFMLKPVSIHDLAGKVRWVLDNQRASD